MTTAKILKHSKARNGTELVTYELEFPRWILAEFNTHRMLSRNAASSRAIPVSKLRSMVWNNPAVPIRWGANKAGMQAGAELSANKARVASFLWRSAGKAACGFSWALEKLGLHKQWTNRLLEPWLYIKVVASATDWDNFFHLRRHPDAQPEIHDLANKMWDAYQKSSPQMLKLGEWHLPYVETERDNGIAYYVNTEKGRLYLSVEDALKVSSSCCAQVSFRLLDNSVEKAVRIYDRLVTSRPVHASPFEHQGTPFAHNITESGNFRGWKQHRDEIEDNVCREYKP